MFMKNLKNLWRHKLKFKTLFQKIRVPLSFLVAVIFLIFSKPQKIYFYMGIPIGISGILIRMWAAGHIVKSKKLTKSGPYQFTRNPLYLGSFLIGTGLSIQCGPLFLLIFLILFAIIYFPVMKREEEEMESVFKDDFVSYKNSVPLFVPYFFKRIKEKGKFNFNQMVKNREYKGILGFLILELLLILKYKVL